MSDVNSILIIGSSGFIGSNFLNYIVNKKFKIVCISLKNNHKIKSNKITHIKCNISNYNILKKKLIIKNYDYVINFSGYVDHSDFNKNGRNIINNHLIGLVNILSIININKIKHFIQIGSSEEYGSLKSPQKSHIFGNSYTPYSFSKQSVSRLLHMLKYNHNLKFTIARIFLVYGPGQSDNRLVPFVIKNCLKNKNFNLTSGNQIRDFVYIDDLITGLYKILKSKKTFGKSINLASGKPISVRQIVNQINLNIGAGKPKFSKINKRKYENNSIYADLNNNKLIKWKAKISLKKGLLKTIKYYSYHA